MKYKVIWTQTLCEEFEVEADSIDEAVAIVEEEFDIEEVINNEFEVEEVDE